MGNVIAPSQMGNKIINGYQAGWISFRMFLRIFGLAFRYCGNFFHAIREVRKFARKRSTIQGYKKIPKYIRSNSKYYFAEHIPGFPSGALDRFMEGELIRQNGNPHQRFLMNTAIFAITSRCSLQCVHCFEWDNLDVREHLQIEDLMVILEKLEMMGLTHIQFGGGEPLVRFMDLLILIERASLSMDCWLLTSGFGLTSRKAIELKKAGLTGASISLDHWDEAMHNQFRNHDKSFEWVREAVQNCREAGIIVTLAFCATREFTTRENVMRYYELAKEWGAGFIKILEARKTGKFRGKDVTLTSGQVNMLMDFYKESYHDPAYCDYPVVMFPGFDQRQVGCLGAGNRYLYIDSKGEIHACPFCHGSAGNAVKDSISEAAGRLSKSGCHVFELSGF